MYSFTTDDRVQGSSGDDTITGGNGDDYLQGDKGNDNVRGVNGDDMLFGEEEQQRLLRPHEYTGEALPLRYQDCISCRHRTEFTCVKCGYCYSCHWCSKKC